MLRVTHTRFALDDALVEPVRQRFERSMGVDGARFLRPMRGNLLRRCA